MSTDPIPSSYFDDGGRPRDVMLHGDWVNTAVGEWTGPGGAKVSIPDGTRFVVHGRAGWTPRSEQWPSLITGNGSMPDGGWPDLLDRGDGPGSAAGTALDAIVKACGDAQAAITRADAAEASEASLRKRWADLGTLYADERARRQEAEAGAEAAEDLAEKAINLNRRLLAERNEARKALQDSHRAHGVDLDPEFQTLPSGSMVREVEVLNIPPAPPHMTDQEVERRLDALPPPVGLGGIVQGLAQTVAREREERAGLAVKCDTCGGNGGYEMYLHWFDCHDCEGTGVCGSEPTKGPPPVGQGSKPFVHIDHKAGTTLTIHSQGSGLAVSMETRHDILPHRMDQDSLVSLQGWLHVNGDPDPVTKGGRTDGHPAGWEAKLAVDPPRYAIDGHIYEDEPTKGGPTDAG